jgi:predicted anti-sigma-YlaC factor YlaD
VSNRIADAVSSGGLSYASEDDPALARDAAPFGLKALEALLEDNPGHRGLLLALSRGFTQYAVAFVAQDAAEAADPDAREEGRKRTVRLCLRARDYGLQGLSGSLPGIRDRLGEDPEGAVAGAAFRDVPLLYWTAASWSFAVATSSRDDLALLADLPRCEALMLKALALDEGFDGGAIHEYFTAFEGGRSEAMGGSPERARAHFEKAMALSGGGKVSPLVTLAETVSVRAQDRREFTSLLDRALAFDAEKGPPGWRLANLVAQRKARWLKGRTDELFLE